MDDRPIDSASLLARLEADAIEHFWVAYHDYGGRAQAKTLPRGEFPERCQRRRRLRHGESEHGRRRSPVGRSHPAGRLRRLPGRSRPPLLCRPPAISGNGSLPRLDARHRRLGLGRLPADRLAAAIDELRDLGYSVQVALEPEFYLLLALPETSADYTPVNTTRMFSSGRSCHGAGLRRAPHRRAARNGRDRRADRQGVRSRSIRNVGPPRGSDPRRRRLLLAQGRGP